MARILLEMLFATQRVGITRPVDKVIVGPKTLSSIIWTVSVIKWGQA
jgi:hypothetical protein